MRYVRSREEQHQILQACHVDPTGHMGVKKTIGKKTIGKISERFMWSGIVKDVKEMVSINIISTA